MTKFYLFADVKYCPSGGVDSLKGTFDTAEEAETALRDHPQEEYFDWAQIVDEELRPVKQLEKSVAGWEEVTNIDWV